MDKKHTNEKLIEEYPFLLPRNRFNGEVSEDYDFQYTELDAMPDGWRAAFGIQMLQELKEILVQGKALETYRIVDIKEKFGALQWCDSGYTDLIDAKIEAWKDKYEELSKHTCIVCGKGATSSLSGRLIPLCDGCKR